MKKEVMWDNKWWIVDYETGTIYQKIFLYENDPELFTVRARFGNYPLKRIGNYLYFEAANNYYQIDVFNNHKIIKISKEEYLEQQKYRYLSAINTNDVRFVSNYVSSIIIDEILRSKYNINISLKYNLNIVYMFSNKFSSLTKRRIDDISRCIISLLPKINKKFMKKEIKKVFKKLQVDDNNLHIYEIINTIYENDKNRFDIFVDEIKHDIENRKRNEHIISKVSEDVSLLESEEKTNSRKNK